MVPVLNRFSRVPFYFSDLTTPFYAVWPSVHRVFASGSDRVAQKKQNVYMNILCPKKP